MLLTLVAGLCCSAVLPSQHRATVSASHRASRVAAASMAVRPPEPTIEVSVRRTPEGGLGIQVDETNTVASCPGQPDLAIGDRIVAINGEQLGRRYLAEVLPPPAEFASIYLFTIERGSADAMDSMERRLERLTEMASADTLAELAKDEVLTSKIVLLAEALEAAAEPQPEAAVAEALRGFWRLAFTNGTMAEGLTGYGTLPMCYVSGLFSAFTETKPDKPDVPTAQLVEVVADRNMGSSSAPLAASNLPSPQTQTLNPHTHRNPKPKPQPNPTLPLPLTPTLNRRGGPQGGLGGASPCHPRGAGALRHRRHVQPSRVRGLADAGGRHSRHRDLRLSG